MRSARTGTLGPARGLSVGKKVALGVAVVAIAGGAPFGIVAALETKKHAGSAGVASDAPASTPIDAAVPTPTQPPVDAPEAPPPPPPPVDAAVAIAPIDAGSGSAEVRPAAKKYGYLEVITDPPMTATLDDGRSKDTPIKNPPWKVTVGRHRVKFANGQTRTVVIQEGKTAKIEILK